MCFFPRRAPPAPTSDTGPVNPETHPSRALLAPLLREPRAWALFGGYWLLVLAAWELTFTWGAPPRWRRVAMGAALVDWASWAAVSVAALALVWWLPHLPARKVRGAAAILLAASALATLRLALIWGFSTWSRGRMPPLSIAAANLPNHVLIVSALMATGYGVLGVLQERERELALARAEGDLIRTRFRALKARLQPRFLFGALDALPELMRRDVPAADRLLLRLSDLLRLTFRDAAGEDLPLGREVELVETFLHVEGLRLAEPSRVALRVEAGAEHRPIPHLAVLTAAECLLLPGGSAGRELEVAARRVGEALRLELRAPGAYTVAECRAAPEWHKVELLNDVLEERFGAGCRWSFTDHPCGGVAAALLLPAGGA